MCAMPSVISLVGKPISIAVPLQSCAGDVNRAVEMFFESGAGDSGHDENAAAIAVAAAEDDG